MRHIPYCLALALVACGGTTPNPNPNPDAGDAGAVDVDDAAADAGARVCYEPSTPLRAYSCDAEADCSNCPTSCDVPGLDAAAGAGECK